MWHFVTSISSPNHPVFHCVCARGENRACVVELNLDCGLIKSTESPPCAPCAALLKAPTFVGKAPLSLCYACNIPLSCCCDTDIVDISAPIRDGCLQGSLSLLIFQSDVNIEQRSPAIFVQAQFLNGKAKQCR